MKYILRSGKTVYERRKLAKRYKPRLYALIRERDRYIAGRIAQSLSEGMPGILFIGATHNISPYIPLEIDKFTCNYVERDVAEWMSK